MDAIKKAERDKAEAERQIKEAKAQLKQSARQSVLNNLTPGGGKIRRLVGQWMDMDPKILSEATKVLAEVQKAGETS